MKKFFIPVIFLSLFLSANVVNAYVTQDEVYSEESMINYGYSADFVEMYNKIQARSNGEPYDYKPSEDPIYKYQPFKSIKRLIYYLDPSSDTSQFLNHDIKNYPNYNDY